ncbi:hypothetical protein CPB84DRAFT_228595 [Gymnopilus junonius]|uniref:Uncharacterized protein n=1 Tax=Gymnopilus junonius TaxID=109634 RepID=A0A9P5TIJ7_GYMJU|nr:hypothetical protein CPB84DRAFT_228595 [Gymnopilus junonius]
MHFNELPAEIRLTIFRQATLKVSQYEDTSVDYRPFEAVALRDRDWSSSAQRALDVKMAVVLVCKEWKRIATEMLYECIRIQHGTEALLTALEGHLQDALFDNGRWVRRVEISEKVLDFDPFNPQMVLRVLERCPLVETVVRPCLYSAFSELGPTLGKVRLEPGQVFPSFPSIKRIDWWSPGVTPGRGTYWNSNPEFFVELVAHAPNLQYLTLSHRNQHSDYWSIISLHRTQNNLFVYPPYKSITTLRIEGKVENAFILANAVLPNLKRLVLGGLYAQKQSIIKTLGHLVRHLEFLDFGVQPDAFSPPPMSGFGTGHVFQSCPNLEEFCAPLSLGTTLLQENTNVVLHNLRCIRIKMDSSTLFTSPDFGYFIRDKLTSPELERICLCGKPEAWKENACYKVLEEIVAQRNLAPLECYSA